MVTWKRCRDISQRRLEKVYLGDAGGGDDGYCPFEDGEYEITYQESDNTITVRWHNSFDWEEVVFELPQ